MKRREARTAAIQTLYQMDVAKIDWEEALHNLLPEVPQDQFLVDLVQGVSQYKEEIDARLRPLLQKWSLDRLPIIDRAILRMAVYELIYREDIPVQASINEAVDLAKVFGEDDSSKFINGVLSSIVNQQV